MGRVLLEVISQGAQINQIRAEDNGEEIQCMVGNVVVEVDVDPGVEEGVLAEEDVVPVGLIHWLATGVGCVVI